MRTADQYTTTVSSATTVLFRVGSRPKPPRTWYVLVRPDGEMQDYTIDWSRHGAWKSVAGSPKSRKALYRQGWRVLKYNRDEPQK